METCTPARVKYTMEECAVRLRELTEGLCDNLEGREVLQGGHVTHTADPCCCMAETSTLL